MSLIIQKELIEKLKNTGSIPYKEICEILDAFQIASGQAFAISKTKALLEYIISNDSLTIKNFNYSDEDKKVFSTHELANIYKNIDELINLYNEKDFIKYF